MLLERFGTFWGNKGTLKGDLGMLCDVLGLTGTTSWAILGCSGAILGDLFELTQT